MIFRPKQLSSEGFDDGHVITLVDGVSVWKRLFGYYWKIDADGDAVLKTGPFAFMFGLGLWTADDGGDIRSTEPTTLTLFGSTMTTAMSS